jgi:Peptidase family M23
MSVRAAARRGYDSAIFNPSKIPIHGRKAAGSALLAALALLAVAAPAGAVDHWTPLSARVLHAPEPVRGGDGREHLVYELVIANDSTFPPRPVTVRQVIVEAEGKTVQTLAGKKLNELMAPFGKVTEKTPRTTIAAGGTAKLLMDVSYPAGARLPRALDHELVVSPGPKGSIESNRFLTAPTTVGTHPAMVVAPPLRGPGWVVINGCCDEYTAHRSGLFSIDGTLHAGERYAIDFIQMTPQGRITDGPNDVLTNYPYYGDEVLSATAGKVVVVRDRLPDGPIDFELAPREAADAGGNEVVVAVKPGVYAYYAHLIPGSAAVKVGQQVKAGQMLGRLGNTGNSNAPHLHFQLMDGPTPLGSEGIPYTFSAFTAEGRLQNFLPFFILGKQAKVDAAPRGPKQAQLPLNLQVVDFPGP